MKIAIVIIFIILVIVILSITINALINSERNNEILLDKLTVLFIIAHPDDEAVFFTPTLMSLKKHNIETYVLCMSNGGGEGNDGDIRHHEMLLSAEYANIPSSNVFISNFNDGHKESWDTTMMIKEIDSIVQSKNIKHIVTFDEYGVTRHPNHISCHTAVKEYQTQSVRKHYLETIGFVMNSMGPLSTLTYVKDGQMSFRSKHFYNTWKQLSHHRSQYTKLWKTYTFFSRYSLLNTYK